MDGLDFPQQPRQERAMGDDLRNHSVGTSRKAIRYRNRRARLFEAQGGKCHWCGEPMEMNRLCCTEQGKWIDNPLLASFEHMIPLAKGGSKEAFNVVLAHSRCNRSRPHRQWAHDPVYGPSAKWHYAKGKRVPGPPPPRKR